MTRQLKSMLIVVLALATGDAFAADTQSAEVIGQFVPKKQWAQVKYEPANGGIYFKANVAGRDVWAMLDTGATQSAMDIELARSAGLTLSAGAASEVRIRIPGQYESRYPKLPVMDLGPVSKLADRKIGFVLGQDFLKRLVLVVDPNRRVFHFVPSGTFKTPTRTQLVPLKSGTPPQVEVKLDLKDAVLSIDTGFSGQLSLSRDASAHFAPRGSVGKIEIGTFMIKNVKVETAPTSTGDGRLGMGILNQARFALDISVGSLWLGPLSMRVDDDD